MRHHQDAEHRMRLWMCPVNYQWATPDGTVHHGRTVVLARSKGGLRDAVKRFWRRHPHVEEAGI